MNLARSLNLIAAARKTFELDLSGLTVFTEAASGYFALTPLVAALAGAHEVIAIGRDSRYGKFVEIENFISNLSKEAGCLEKIRFVNQKRSDDVSRADILTNLGFVRPIDDNMVSWMKATAAVPLMWEPWEFRPEDVDLRACEERQVAILGTNENARTLRTFEFVGLLGVKLLLEEDIEVVKSNIVVLGSGHFGFNTMKKLAGLGANVLWIDPHGKVPQFPAHVNRSKGLDDDEGLEFLSRADAIVIVEHESKEELIGVGASLDFETLRNMNEGITVIHICGGIDVFGLKNSGLRYAPAAIRPSGFMSLTTAYLGPRPLIDLHTAGLRVGELLARARIAGKSVQEAKEIALRMAPAKDF
jgi:hypothetical protein